MYESKIARESSKLSGADRARTPADRTVSWNPGTIYKIIISIVITLLLMLWVSNASHARRAPSDNDMAEHFSDLSPTCQKLAGTMLKNQILEKQEVMSNEKVEKLIKEIDSRNCTEMNNQIDQIDRAINPTILYTRDL